MSDPVLKELDNQPRLPTNVDELFPPILWRDDPGCDSIEIRECKRVLRRETLALPSRIQLAATMADRLTWVAIAGVLRDALTDAVFFLDHEAIPDEGNMRLLRAALQDADALLNQGATPPPKAA